MPPVVLEVSPLSIQTRSNVPPNGWKNFRYWFNTKIIAYGSNHRAGDGSTVFDFETSNCTLEALQIKQLLWASIKQLT
jgi:hypothetical protein